MSNTNDNAKKSLLKILDLANNSIKVLAMINERTKKFQASEDLTKIVSEFYSSPIPLDVRLLDEAINKFDGLSEDVVFKINSLRLNSI